MVQWLNNIAIKKYFLGSPKFLFCLALIFLGLPKFFTQNNLAVTNYPDYKDNKQFKKFYRHRDVTTAWQINQLKDGALVVKLKTNSKQVNALNKIGNTKKAIEKTIETFIVNKNIMMAYLDRYNFSKVYFVYSHFQDSLLKGIRSGIFLDTNLVVNNTIEMKESFYLIAEKDFAYNSSIGFVKEDSARYAVEKGNPSGGMWDIVVKNKYGHQLKRPFPYLGFFGNIIVNYSGPVPMYYKYDSGEVTYSPDKTQMADKKVAANKNFKKAPKGYSTLFLGKGDIYEMISGGIENFNDDLIRFYRRSPKVELDKIDADIKPFLY
jgi:hypothetical protein